MYRNGALKNNPKLEPVRLRDQYLRIDPEILEPNLGIDLSEPVRLFGHFRPSSRRSTTKVPATSGRPPGESAQCPDR